MKIEVSNGEILDKLTILRIKKDKIIDTAKSLNVNKEYLTLLPLYDQIVTAPSVIDLFERLYKINQRLWEVEDELRLLERNKDFSDSFIQLARSVYDLNDTRAETKKIINILTNSNLIEEKSYEKY